MNCVALPPCKDSSGLTLVIENDQASHRQFSLTELYHYLYLVFEYVFQLCHNTRNPKLL